MKKLFYSGMFLWLVFEVLNIYFIMPMPGSQDMQSVEAAHFLHAGRWLFRLGFGLMIAIGMRQAWSGRKWMAVATAGLTLTLVAVINLKMSADVMFLQPRQLRMQDAGSNGVPLDKLVLGIEYQGEARAYPIQLIAYHHQVVDTIAGKPLMITYCSVCRTGRVFEPMVGGQRETFRLVGMDHFNAMFEDANSGTWWRQANGEAVAGKLKGQFLPEWPSLQTSLRTWLALHPRSRIMQPDPAFADEYASLESFETGRRSGGLTGTDTAYGADKSWVVGIAANGQSKAYDWNRLRKARILHDEVGGKPVLLVLASDDQSFFAFGRPNASDTFALSQDTILGPNGKFSLDGKPFLDGTALQPVAA
ncbi:MAG TPA: DUF3179 domain-containing (seleno)protein, partial [Bacteroidia bacterium]|nr:DUF3179 domain-containing (seleno)protein [Bacteroidia bacterium]